MKLSSVHKQIDNTNDFTEQSPIMNESDVSPYSKNLSPLKLKSFIQILETTGESK